MFRSNKSRSRVPFQKVISILLLSVLLTTNSIFPVSAWSSEARQPDEDGVIANVHWSVLNPNFNVRANEDRVEANEWPLGNTVALEINDPGTLKNPDYTDTQTVGLNPKDPNQTLAEFDLRNVFDIKSGFVVSMSDGTTTKTHIVTSLAVTDYNLDLDKVTGVAALGSHVDVWACDSSNCYNRHVTADGVGNWTADFAHPGAEGDEQTTLDIAPGVNGNSSQADEDGDSTSFSWRVLNPYIEANPGKNWVHGCDWPNGTPLTLTIDDPSNGSGVDKTVHATMGPAPWDPNYIVADFNLDGFDLQPGQILKVTDGATPPTERTYTLSNIDITGFDLDADTISGIATPGVEVQVCANGPGKCVPRYVTSAALTGTWTVDYGHPGTRDDEQELVDLQPGNDGSASERDENGNLTQADWRVPKPYINVRANEDRVEANEWPLGNTVALEINDPGTLKNPDYTDTQTVETVEKV